MEAKRCPGCMKQKKQSPVCEHCGFDETTANASHQLPMGTVLKEQYLIGKVLGQGGFGITYLGWDLYLDIPLAIKEYYPNGLVMRDSTTGLDVVSCEGDEGKRFLNNKERFLREAKMLARFSQMPEIVQVKNFFLANNTAYIAMEYVEGTTLKQYVKNSGGSLPPEETLTILKPVMEALAKVHKTGLIHRDISPDNIMMLPGGGAKLLDFGAGRDVGAAMVGQSLTSSTEAILKPGYAPIEQYQKRGNLGPWTDVYALCGTVYYCLTGQVPPDAPERMLEYDEAGLFDQIPGLTEPQKAALEHGMAIRTEQRTPSMDELCRELYEIQPQPEPAPEPVKPEPVPEKKPVPEGKPAPAKTEAKQKHRKKKKGIPPRLTAFLVVGCIVGLAIAMVLGGEEGNFVAIGPKNGECGADVRWTLDSQTGVLTLEGTGPMADYLYPEETENEEGLPPWYPYRAKIQSVVVGGEVATIGSNAFANCENLTDVTLNKTVEQLGSGAFRNTALTQMEIPYQVSMIGGNAFAGCGDLLELTIYRDTAISYDTWEGPLVTDEYGRIPSTFTIRGFSETLAEDYAEIFGYSFDAIATAYWDAEGKCGNNLQWHLDLETGLLKIDGQGAMYDFNGSWQDQNWQNGYRSNRSLPPWSDYREKIRMVSIGDGVTGIGENAFERCTYLRDVHFGAGLETIGAYAFHTCNIDQIVLPDNVTEIAANAFTWCLDLHDVQLPMALEVLHEYTFNCCQNIKALYVGADTVLEDKNATPFGDLVSAGIPGDIVIYSVSGSDAERFCNDYYFPDFAAGYAGMPMEETGQCGNALYWFISGDTLVLYGDGDSWLYGITEEERIDWAERDWPGEYLHEGNPDFYEFRDGIRHIRILPGVDGLNHRLFTDFQNLETIDFGTVRETHMCVNNCSLEYARIPQSMTFVGEWLFGWCEKLRVVEIAGGSEGFGDGVFAGCVNLEQVWLEDSALLENVDLLNPNQDSEYSSKVVFFVRPGSAAEQYMTENGLKYGYH